MPRYQYYCDECERGIDQDIPLAKLDDTVVKCFLCGGTMRRAIGNEGGFRLLGACWERDNYARYLGDDPRYKE